MEDKNAKIINLKSPILNSPLLETSEIEEKDYMADFNNFETSDDDIVAEGEPSNDDLGPEPKEIITQDPIYDNDEIEGMHFNEEPEYSEQEQESTQESQQQAAQIASGSADMVIGLYSSFIPPILSDMVKSDIPRIKSVLTENTQIPESSINEIEAFLQTGNKEIEQALNLNPEQVSMLKAALAKVLEQYDIQPQSPVVQLLIVVGSIAAMQFMTVKRLLKQREEELIRFIQKFKVVVPEADQKVFTKKNIFVKSAKSDDITDNKEAA